MKKLIALTLAGLSIATTAAYAQTTTMARTGFSLGGEGAYAWGIDNNHDGYNTTTVTDDKDSVAAYRIFAGFQFQENFGIEVAYFGTGQFKKTSANVVLGSTLNTVETKLKAQGWELAPIFKFTQGIPGLFIRAGVTHSKLSGDGVESALGVVTSTVSGDTTGTGYLYGAGYERTIVGNLDGRISYTRYERLGGEKEGKMNFVSLGLKFNF